MNRNGALTAPAEIAPAGQQLRTPFLRARQAWDDRTGALLVQKANWQRATVALTVAVVVLCLAVAFLAGKVTVKAYVVEVAETGQIRSVGILPQAWTGQHLAPVEFVVRQWLLWTRTISTDPVVFAQHWEAARDFMTHKGWAMLTGHLRAQHTRMQRGETVQIQFGTMLPVAGHARSFEVEWREQAFNQQGYQLADTSWKAILKIAIFPPTDLATLKEMRNPLGIFVEEVQWAERTK
jgi:type IV secretory pathway TrbF-like protein